MRQETYGPGPGMNVPTWVAQGVRRVSQNPVNPVSTEQGNRESSDGSHWVPEEAGRA